MSNTLAWLVVLSAAIVSSVAITAAAVWTVKEDEPRRAAIKMVLTALLAVAVIFLMGYMTTIVHL